MLCQCSIEPMFDAFDLTRVARRSPDDSDARGGHLQRWKPAGNRIQNFKGVIHTAAFHATAFSLMTHRTSTEPALLG